MKTGRAAATLAAAPLGRAALAGLTLAALALAALALWAVALAGPLPVGHDVRVAAWQAARSGAADCAVSLYGPTESDAADVAACTDAAIVRAAAAAGHTLP